ncbi:MAG: hypothetical protein ACP5IB_06810 [Thermoplasmata archaeon]
MIIKKTNLNFAPYLIRHFYGYALNLGIISPIFEAIPKMPYLERRANSKNQGPFFKGQKKEV